LLNVFLVFGRKLCFGRCCFVQPWRRKPFRGAGSLYGRWRASLACTMHAVLSMLLPRRAGGARPKWRAVVSSGCWGSSVMRRWSAITLPTRPRCRIKCCTAWCPTCLPAIAHGRFAQGFRFFGTQHLFFYMGILAGSKWTLCPWAFSLLGPRMRFASCICLLKWSTDEREYRVDLNRLRRGFVHPENDDI
jgi:hypothetical protein